MTGEPMGDCDTLPMPSSASECVVTVRDPALSEDLLNLLACEFAGERDSAVLNSCVSARAAKEDVQRNEERRVWEGDCGTRECV